MISVRQASDLPPASFRFPVTQDTLALGYILPAVGRIGDFHPLKHAPAGRTRKRQLDLLPLPVFLFLQNEILQEIPDPFAADRISKFSQCLRLDLTNTLSRYVELFSDLFQSSRMSVLETKAKHDDLAFSLLEIT